MPSPGPHSAEVGPQPGDLENRTRTDGAVPSLESCISPDGVDLTVIRWMLGLTPTERLQAVQDLVDGTWALRAGDEA